MNKSQVTVQIVNAFTKDGKGGNPAGVVIDADTYSEADMQAIAAKVGLSETSFVSNSETEGFKLDFFTPNKRIAHCGHATIATFSYLKSLERVGEGETSKETVDGPRKIIIAGEQAYMEQLAPVYSSEDNWDAAVTNIDILNSLGLKEEQLASSSPILRVNTGNNFIVLEVKNAKTLAAITPDQEAISEISEKLDLIGYYVFVKGSDARARMFAPFYGIEEEAATGMAAGPLACYLYDILGLKKPEYKIIQGEFMTPASPSRITVKLSLEGNKITGLMAGGTGNISNTKTVEI